MRVDKEGYDSFNHVSNTHQNINYAIHGVLFSILSLYSVYVYYSMELNASVSCKCIIQVIVIETKSKI